MRSVRRFGRLFVIASLTALAAGAATRPDRAFEKVPGGVFAVYAIDDMTAGHVENADLIDKLIRQTIAVDRWTTANGTGAAMRTTPERLTVKAAEDVHRQIATLLKVLRQGRNLFVQVDYQIIDSAGLDPKTPILQLFGEKPRLRIDTPASDRVRAKAGLPKAPDVAIPKQNLFAVIDPGVLPADARTVLTASQVTILNGDDATWIDGVGLALPTVNATATLSADRKYATIALTIINEDGQSTKVVKSAACDSTAAVPLNAARTRWLLFTPTCVRSQIHPG